MKNTSVSSRNRRGFNLEDVQQMNRSLVMRLLRQQRICSRADLAKMTGLKQPTITNIINDFLSWGLVTETGIIDGEKGRRSIGLTFNTELFKVVAARISRRYFSVGLFDLFGNTETLIQEQIDISENSQHALLRVRQSIEMAMEGTPADRILGIGVAIPGPFVRRDGKIALMTEFPGWETVAIEKELQSHFSVPVFLEHDANSGALAEWSLGPHRLESGTMVFVAAGAGLGAGIVIDGQLFRGTLGTAGEIGHTSIEFDGPRCECGNNGCLEHYCSTIALARDVKKELVRYPDSPLQRDHSFDAIISALNAGDELAIDRVKKVAWYLGVGLVNVVNAYNPDVIIIGDDLAKAGDVLLQTLKETMRPRILPSIYNDLVVELSSFPVDTMVVGMSTLVADKVLHRLAKSQTTTGGASVMQ